MNDAPEGDTGVRLNELERRLTQLETAWAGTHPAQVVSSTPDEVGASNEPTANSGTIGYTGRVDLVGPVHWDIRYGTDATLTLPAEALVPVFAAMAHPARIRIVRLLLRGNRSVTQLQEADDFGTTGQLYHHLKALTGASIVTKVGRNEYGIAATHTVPLLVSLLTAADISGSL